MGTLIRSDTFIRSMFLLDLVFTVNKDTGRFPVFRFRFLDHHITGNDDQVPFSHFTGRSAVEADDSGISFSLDCIRGESLPVVHVLSLIPI